MKKKTKDGVVFSTDPNFQFQFEEEEQAETLDPAKQDLRIWLDRKVEEAKMLPLSKVLLAQMMIWRLWANP
jgi:translation initiation factor 1